MADLGKTYESVCSEEGKENVVQPYMWLGIEDSNGSGKWRNVETGEEIAATFEHWDDDEGREGDTCARMQGNGEGNQCGGRNGENERQKGRGILKFIEHELPEAFN